MMFNYLKIICCLSVIMIIFAGCIGRDSSSGPGPSFCLVSPPPTTNNTTKSSSAYLLNVSSPSNPGGLLNLSNPGNGTSAQTYACLNSASNVVFDNVTVRLPAGTQFTLTTGDLSPTGIFTTTAELSANLSGSFAEGSTGLVNATLTLIDSVSGSYTYLGTSYDNGDLDNSGPSTMTFTNVYAQGIFDPVTVTFSGIGSATGIVSNTINILLPTQDLTGSFAISQGTYDGQIFVVAGPSSANYDQGTLNSDGTMYTNAQVTFKTSCLDGKISAVNFHIGPLSLPNVLVTQATVIGSTTGATNGIEFDGTHVQTGTYTDSNNNVNPGTCV